jgi:hypothetical protein
MRVWRTVATLAALGCVMSHMLAGIGGHPTCPPWLSLLGVVLGNLLFPAIHTSSFDAPPHWRITIRDETRVTLGWCAARRKSLTAAAKRLDDRDRYAYTARHELLSHISDMIEGPGFSWADRDDAIVLARRVLSARARWVLTEEDNR